MDVVDLGAGTGKLTPGLVALGHRVTAVEPLEEMLGQLRRASPEVTAVAGHAERFSPAVTARHCTPAEREKVLAEVDRLYDEVTGPDGVVLPYVTDCYRTAKH